MKFPIKILCKDYGRKNSKGALRDGFITPEAAGTYATSEDAAYSWLDKHYLNLPDSARPERSDLRAFSNFLDYFLLLWRDHRTYSDMVIRLLTWRH